MIEMNTAREGLVVRQLQQEDASAHFDAVEASRDHLMEFSAGVSAAYPTLESVEESIANPTNPEKLRFGIWSAETFVGSIDLRSGDEGHEVGYWLDARHTGNGYATLAVSAVTNYAREYKDANRVFAEVLKGNEGSKRVLDRAGYVEVGKYARRLVFDHLKAEDSLATQIDTIDISFEKKVRAEFLRSKYESTEKVLLEDLRVDDEVIFLLRDIQDKMTIRRIEGCISPRSLASPEGRTQIELLSEDGHNNLIEITADSYGDGYKLGDLINFGCTSMLMTEADGAREITGATVMRSMIVIGAPAIVDNAGMHFFNKGAENRYIPMLYSEVWVNGVQVAAAIE